MATAWRAFAITSLVLGSGGGLAWMSVSNMGSNGPAPAMSEGLQLAYQKRGSYLMMTLCCNDCHTPRDASGQPINGMTLAGHPDSAPLPQWDPSMLEKNILMTMDPTGTAFAGPWGVSIAPNLTPDKETGIGNLSAEALIQSWRSGKHWKLDRAIMPPMPATFYAVLTDDDIRALHAFLQTLPPVRNRAPDSIPAAPVG